MKFFIVVTALFFNTLSLFAQSLKAFTSPVCHQIFLAGNVGEIRSSHFHAGIDIKATDGVGSDILAIGDGYISRIGVSPTGYGNVLYVSHPNGYTSVYAHLDGFIPEVQKWVKERQYKARSFKVNLYPTIGQFPVKKGQIIGYMGNSGSSSGAHLHFEIRNQHNHPLNLNHLNLYKIKDNIPPTLYKVTLYEADTTMGVVHYHPKQTIDIAAGERKLYSNKNFYLAYELIDHKNYVHNTFGIYSLEQSVNGKKNFGFSIPHTNYSTTKYVKAFVQYEQNLGNRNHVIRAYTAPNNSLGIYSGVIGNGVISPSDSVQRIDVTLVDDSHNSKSYDFMVLPDTDSIIKNRATGYLVSWYEPFVFSTKEFSVSIPKHALYESLFLPFEQDSTTKIYTIGNPNHPLSTPLTFTIPLDSLDTTVRSKALLKTIKGSRVAKLNHSTANKYSAKIYTMGEYQVVVDTLPPTIRYRGIANNALNFTIKDNLSGIKTYSIEVDGKWVLGEWDPKKSHLFHKIKRNTTPKTHKVVVKLTDYCQNKTEKIFNIKW